MQNISKNVKISLNDLYKLAEEKGIHVTDFSLPENKAVTIELNNSCFVGVDPAVFGSLREERVVLAHEIGHIETGGLYKKGCTETSRRQKEAKAEKWAITCLIPYEELIKAGQNGFYDIPSLADYFDVTEEFMEKALNYYTKN